MPTVFSHIIQKRFSASNEDVATDALAYILQSSESARTGMMKLIRGIVADMPVLQFRTQQAEGSIKPDMWGYHESEPRVFIENKFWAGLTENQPVAYLKRLAEYPQPTILLVVGPEARALTLQRELEQRLEIDGISTVGRDIPAGFCNCVSTGLGPIFALTTWPKLLSALDLEVADDLNARNDIGQLRSLCEAADINAFIPVSSFDLTDQRIPAFMIQLGTIIQASVDLAVNEKVLNIDGLRPQSDWDGFGRYARFSSKKGIGVWYGVYYDMWKTTGRTPLWLVFLNDEFGRAEEVRRVLEPWAAREGIVTDADEYEFDVAIDIETGEDKDRVVRAIVDRLKAIAKVLSTLKSRK